MSRAGWKTQFSLLKKKKKKIRWGRGCVWLGISGWRFSPLLSPEHSFAPSMYLTLFSPLGRWLQENKNSAQSGKDIGCCSICGDSSWPPGLGVSLQDGHQHTWHLLHLSLRSKLSLELHFLLQLPSFFFGVSWEDILEIDFSRFLSLSSPEICCLGIWELVTLSLCMVRWGGAGRASGRPDQQCCRDKGLSSQSHFSCSSQSWAASRHSSLCFPVHFRHLFPSPRWSLLCLERAEFLTVSLNDAQLLTPGRRPGWLQTPLGQVANKSWRGRWCKNQWSML